jgi:hypothetical protein
LVLPEKSESFEVNASFAQGRDGVLDRLDFPSPDGKVCWFDSFIFTARNRDPLKSNTTLNSSSLKGQAKFAVVEFSGFAAAGR